MGRASFVRRSVETDEMQQGVGVRAVTGAMILGAVSTMPALAGVIHARADRSSTWPFVATASPADTELSQQVMLSRILPDPPAPMTGPTWRPTLFEATMATTQTDPVRGEDTDILWLHQDITVAALLTRRGKGEVPDLEQNNRSASNGILDVLFVIPSPGTIAIAAFSALMSARRRR